MGAMKISLEAQYEKTGSAARKRAHEFSRLSAQIFADLTSAKSKGVHSRTLHKRSEPSEPWTDCRGTKELHAR